MIIDLIGIKFCRLLVIKMAGRVGRNAQWECRCDCGEIVRVSSGSLRKGSTVSCGCARREVFEIVRKSKAENICLWCGKKSVGKYCTKSHQKSHMRSKKKRTCAACGSEFVQKILGGGRDRKYCSYECKQRAANERHYAKKAVSDLATIQAKIGEKQ